jgi:hypothetical protein
MNKHEEYIPASQKINLEKEKENFLKDSDNQIMIEKTNQKIYIERSLMESFFI